MFKILVERELPRPVAASDPIALLWDSWDAGRRDAPVMRREAFDAFAFPMLLGRLNLVSIEPSQPTRFVFRLFGSGMDDPFESDMTRRTVGDIREPAYADLVQRHYLQAYRLRRPCFAEVKADIGEGNQFHYCRLILPMTSGAGDFDMMLVASVRYGDDRFWHKTAGTSRLGQAGAYRYAEDRPEAAHKWHEAPPNLP